MIEQISTMQDLTVRVVYGKYKSMLPFVETSAAFPGAVQPHVHTSLHGCLPTGALYPPG